MSAIESIAEDDQNESMTVLSNVLGLGVAEGRLPARIDVEFAMLQLMGPIVLATIAVGGDAPRRVVDQVVDRFLASWQ